MPTSKQLTILVGSCDRYADLLLPFSQLWKKYWSDCPYELVLATESYPSNADSLAFDRIIAVGLGKSWSQLMQEVLEQVETPYLIYLCDDYFLSKPVETATIASLLDLCQQYNAANLRMLPNPQPARDFELDTSLGVYDKNTAYCVATQAGIWAKDFFLRLVKNCDCIWEFERLGSFACGDEPRPILCTKEQVFPFVDAVHKGHWESFGVQVLRDAGFEPDLSTRKLPTLYRRAIEWGKGFIYRLNPSLVVRIQNRFGLGMTERTRR